MSVVLASGSPRRREMLEMIGIKDFRVLPDTAEEEIQPGLTPDETVCGIALRKAENVSLLCDKDDLIIAADTLVYLDGAPIAKPSGPSDAAEMLRALSGRKHTVYTGVALIKGADRRVCAEKTDVYFREITDEEILAYVATGEPLDKAGAYGAQGRAAVFVERVEGEFFNVMGMPLCRLSVMLKELGVEV